MTSNYRALYGRIDPISGSIPLVGELPVIDSVTIEDVLDNVGSVQLSMPLDLSTAPVKLTGGTSTPILASDLSPGRMFLAIERGGVIVGGGIVWATSMDTSTNVLNITAQDARSFLERRYITDGYISNSQEVRSVIEDMLSYGVYGPLTTETMIELAPGNNTGNFATLIYEASELKNVYEVIEDLTGRAGKAHVRVYTRLEGSNFTNYMDVLTIRKTPGSSLPVFELGTNILALSVDNDGTGITVQAFASGEGFGATESGSEVVTVTNTVAQANGEFPDYQNVYQLTDVEDEQELRDNAIFRLNTAKAHASQISLTVHPDTLPTYGTYPPGTVIRVKANHGLLQLDDEYVVIGVALTDETSGSTVEIECVQYALFGT